MLFELRTLRTLLARRKSPTWTTGPRGRTTQGKTLNVCKFMDEFYTFLQEEGDRGPQELCRGGEPGQVIQLSILTSSFYFPHVQFQFFFTKNIFQEGRNCRLEELRRGRERPEEGGDRRHKRKVCPFFFFFLKKLFI